jgi:nitrite reductase (NO-forming)
MRTRTATPLAALAALAVASGCGGAGAPVRTDATSLEITLDDYLIRPQEITVPAGKRLTVTIVNRGRLGHTLRLRRGGADVFEQGTIPPGERVTRRLRPKAGTYTMYCAIANHEELGMHGTFEVG